MKTYRIHTCTNGQTFLIYGKDGRTEGHFFGDSKEIADKALTLNKMGYQPQEQI